MLALLIAAHLWIIIALHLAGQSPPAAGETFMQVHFIAEAAPEPPLPKPPLRRAAAPRDIVPSAPTSSDAAAPPRAAQSLSLFGLDGSIRMPVASPFVPTQLAAGEELMHRGHNIVHCRTTQFARAYKRDESLGDEISRKYLVWIGLYNRDVIEARAARRRAEAASACDQ